MSPILGRARPFAMLAAAGFSASLITGGTAVALTPSQAPPRAAAPAEVTALVANNTLLISGTNGPDVITLAVDPNNANVLEVNTGTTVQNFDRTTFTAIVAQLGGGDDHFSVVTTGLTDKALFVDGGNGNDVIVGSDGNDVLLGGNGSDQIFGASGDDLIFGGSGSDFVDGGRGTDTAFLQGGKDSFQWDPGDGSDNVDGGGGQDGLIFHGANIAEKMTLSANGHRSVFTRDVGTIRMDMDGTDFRQANIDLSAAGGAGDGAADLVTLNGGDAPEHVAVGAAFTGVDVKGLRPETVIMGSEVALDHLQINTFGGNDRINVDPATATQIGVTTDLGTGQH